MYSEYNHIGQSTTDMPLGTSENHVTFMENSESIYTIIFGVRLREKFQTNVETKEK